MSTYATILALSLLGPLLFSFDKRIRFVALWPAAFGSTLLVAPIFLLWDGLATHAGHWSFSTSHTWSLRLLELPLEEILFFVVAPFCCLFIHHSLNVFLKQPSGSIRSWHVSVLGAICFAGAIAAYPRMYTFVVLVFAAVFFTLLATGWAGIIPRFWLTQVLCFVPFLVVNGLLTGIPVVTYASEAILGPRLVTIPIEDCLYSFVLVGCNLFVFDSLKRRRSPREAI